MQVHNALTSFLLLYSVWITFVRLNSNVRPFRTEASISAIGFNRSAPSEVVSPWNPTRRALARSILSVVEAHCAESDILVSLDGETLRAAFLWSSFSPIVPHIHIALSADPTDAWFSKLDRVHIELLNISRGVAAFSHAARRSEVVLLYWSQLDADDSAWVFPRTPIAIDNFLAHGPKYPFTRLVMLFGSDFLPPASSLASPLLLAMQRIPRILHHAWVGSAPPPLRLINQCKSLHPTWQHFFWTDANATELFDPVSLKIFNEEPSLNGKGDIVRWFALARYGGVWLDADSRCQKPLDPIIQTGSNFFIGHHSLFNRLGEGGLDYLLACGVVGCTPKHPIIELVTQKIIANPRGAAWQMLGPCVISSAFYESTYGALLPGAVACPVFYFVPHHHMERGQAPLAGFLRSSYVANEWGTTHGKFNEWIIEKRSELVPGCPQ